jgi:hypothetical protein
VHVGFNRQGAYASAGLPGTGIYAIHHIRSGDSAMVTGSAAGFILGFALVVLLIVGKACV